LSIKKLNEFETEDDPIDQDMSFEPSKMNEDLGSFLKKLKSEEAYLLEEKSNLTARKDQLLLKANVEIDSYKNRIKKLKEEIAELKADCEALSTSLSMEQ
jgi:uncharacterized protein (DUF885 family)